MISDPDPTEVIPTTSPPSRPTSAVGSGRTLICGVPSCASGASSVALRRLIHALRTSPEAATSSATPSAFWTTSCTSAPCPSARATSTPANADGTDPTHSHPTRRRLTVPRRRWTRLPTGFITAAATRSLDTAASGLTPKKVTSIGVISAPPPIPVSPTTTATRKEPPAIAQSKCIGMTYQTYRKS